jgi:uncharacterized membrane protein YphA (DoxX/SURF4 family)
MTISTRPSLEARSPLAPAPFSPSETRQGWHPATRIAFRFSVLYFTLYAILDFPALFLTFRTPFQLNLSESSALRGIFIWVGRHLFGIPVQFRRGGDTTFQAVFLATLLIIAALGTIIWSAIAQDRHSHPKVFAWSRFFLRFALGTTLVAYGIIKVFKLQMPAPSLADLVEPYGNMSPFNVLWASIGSAPGYEMFVGLAEVCAGLLVMVPITATAGALMCLMDTIAIFTLNIAYDVSVKTLSLHLMLISAFLVAPHARRLFDLFVLHRGATIASEPPLGESPRARRNFVIFQVLYALCILANSTFGTPRFLRKMGAGDGPSSPLYGIWNIQEMTVDGEPRPLLVTDTARFRRLIFQRPTTATLQRMTDAFVGYGAAVDTTAKTLTLTARDSAKTVSRLSYQRPAQDRMLIDGTLDGHTVHMELASQDPDQLPQRSHRFRWLIDR